MKDDAKARRARENADLLKRMNEGDNLCHTGLGAFRWAPRPLVKKNDRDLKRIFGESQPDAKREVKGE